MTAASYNRGVFINCPFDEAYTPLFRSMVFAIITCGFDPRCAVEDDDSSDVRLTKIYRIISECRFGIHDLSRTRLDRQTKLPRFNMPLELGLFLAAKHFGRDEQDQKVCLVFERITHSYEKFISDIKGQDIYPHENSPHRIIGKVRDWLSCNSRRRQLPGGHVMNRDYARFLRWLPKKCRAVDLRERDLTFNDFAQLVYAWHEEKESSGHT